jgi:copper homeostasis protein
MFRRILIEICAYSLESAIAAQEGGADRVELCTSPSEGGTTPSVGTLELARKHLKIKLNVLIRPRGGDSLYTAREFGAMKRDIQLCKQLGVDGVVVGLLLPNGQVDRERSGELVELAQPMSVTFHRAFDMAADPFTSLEDAIAIGCDRILTSGQAPSAMDGAGLIADLVQRAGERIIIMPGGGVRDTNLALLAAKTQAREFHSSARTLVSSAMQFRNPKVSLGGTGEDEYQLLMADEDQVARMRAIGERLSAGGPESLSPSG